MFTYGDTSYEVSPSYNSVPNLREGQSHILTRPVFRDEDSAKLDEYYNVLVKIASYVHIQLSENDANSRAVLQNAIIETTNDIFFRNRSFIRGTTFSGSLLASLMKITEIPLGIIFCSRNEPRLRVHDFLCLHPLDACFIPPINSI